MEESFWKRLWTCRLTDYWWWWLAITDSGGWFRLKPKSCKPLTCLCLAKPVFQFLLGAAGRQPHTSVFHCFSRIRCKRWRFGCGWSLIMATLLGEQCAFRRNTIFLLADFRKIHSLHLTRMRYTRRRFGYDRRVNSVTYLNRGAPFRRYLGSSWKFFLKHFAVSTHALQTLRIWWRRSLIQGTFLGECATSLYIGGILKMQDSYSPRKHS